MDTITIRQLSHAGEARLLDEQFALRYPWYQSGDYYGRCLRENDEGKRITLLAYDAGELAGCCHLLFESRYPPFRERHIPEIYDLEVFREFRRRGIASRLLDRLEEAASAASAYVGLGVGLYKDYGDAQRLYVKRAYMPDGNGVTYRHFRLKPGDEVRVDDHLLAYWIKELAVRP